MILEVVTYGHPALRKKGRRIETITPEIRTFISDMLETMHDYRGIGLASQQVAQDLQLTVVDVREVSDRPSWAEQDGRRVDVASLMPLILINPEVTPVGPPEKGPEGCLSFPEIYAEITRASSVDVKALDGDGNPIEFRCGGLLARAVLHEVDHLNGILFIDRMSSLTKEELRPELEQMQAETRARLQSASRQ